MLIGYARVSKTEQNLDAQLDALDREGCETVFTDKESGARDERPGVEQALSHARKGDTLVVWKLDRLGRSLRHLVDTVADLDKRGVQFKSLSEQIDTASPTGKLVFHLFAALAEFERDLIRERTKAALAAARACGRKGGRPRSLDEKKSQQARTLHADHTNSIGDICRTLRISKATLYRYLGDGHAERKAGRKAKGH